VGIYISLAKIGRRFMVEYPSHDLDFAGSYGMLLHIDGTSYHLLFLMYLAVNINLLATKRERQCIVFEKLRVSVAGC